MRGRFFTFFLLPLAIGACQRSTSPPQPPPNVVLVVLDTLRADAVSGIGAQNWQTPTLAHLAREGVLFTNARSTSAWTVPAHASIFTGRFPSRHGAHGEGRALALEAETLAELLSPSYETLGLSENPHIRSDKQFNQGFDRFRNTWPRYGRRPSRTLLTNRLAVEWLESRDTDRPFFLFLNYMSPHLPYDPPVQFEKHFVDRGVDAARLQELRVMGEREARQWIAQRLSLSSRDLTTLRQLYAAEAAFVDAQMARVIEALRLHGWLDQTLVIVVGDHGENIGDHNLMGHQFSLYESVLRVPLVMRWPGRLPAGTRRDDPVQLVDLFPTILEVAGVERELWPAHEGVNLLAGPVEADRPVVAEYMVPEEQQRIFAKEVPEFDFTPLMRRLKSIQIGSEKLIVKGHSETELYDLADDPDEQINLATERPDRVQHLARRLQQWQAAGPPPFESVEAVLSQETVTELRQLGYLD